MLSGVLKSVSKVCPGCRKFDCFERTVTTLSTNYQIESEPDPDFSYLRSDLDIHVIGTGYKKVTWIIVQIRF